MNGPPVEKGRLLYFAHIPKCGGTSLRRALEAALGPDRCVALYRVEDASAHRGYSALWRELIGAGVAPETAALRIVARCEAEGIRLLSTHFNRAFRIAIPPERTFTVLRDPVARLLSAWNHRRARGAPVPGGDFRGFALAPSQRNRQSRALAHEPLRRLAVVGAQERFDASVRAIGARFGLDLQILQENVTRSAGALQRHDLPEALVAEIEARHARDVRLHRRALDLMAGGGE